MDEEKREKFINDIVAAHIEGGATILLNTNLVPELFAIMVDANIFADISKKINKIKGVYLQ